MRLLFVMDSLDRVSSDKDTTYAFLRAAEHRGHESFHALVSDVYARGNRAFVRARPIAGFGAWQRIPDPNGPRPTLGEAIDCPIDELDVVFVRKDPPFDAAYLYLTHLLELVQNTLIVNRPRGLRDANEKLYAMHFAAHMPDTMVSADPARILAFVAEVGGQAVIKPLDGAGGTGVFMLRHDDKNARGLCDMLTFEGRRLAMVQQFLPSVSAGDKRVLLIGGNVLGAINRIARGDDFRSNIHVGGRVEPTPVTDAERALVADIAPKLAEDGLHFVGLDLIGGKLTEVNVTSPTGIQELSMHLDRDVALDVVDWAVAHTKR